MLDVGVQRPPVEGCEEHHHMARAAKEVDNLFW